MRVLALGLAALGLAATAAQAFPPKLPPVDECSSEPGFTAFREQLRQVVSKKDRQALLKMLASNVIVNFGGGEGPNAFAGAWGLDRPADSEAQRVLDERFARGDIDEGEYVARLDLLGGRQ